jgi:AcrR family transcriptional regulator
MVSTQPPTRLSRREQNERNRAAILESARAVFLGAGYHGASVDAVAREAGMTTGAIYSRFEGKADLFLALLEQRIAERALQFAGVGGATRASAAEEFARRWSEIMRSDLDWSLLVIEFRVHAARDPELAERYADLHRRALSALAGNLAASVPDGAEIPEERLDAAARVGMVAATGAALARAAEGADFGEDLYVELTRAIATQFLGMEQP